MNFDWFNKIAAKTPPPLLRLGCVLLLWLSTVMVFVPSMSIVVVAVEWARQSPSLARLPLPPERFIAQQLAVMAIGTVFFLSGIRLGKSTGLGGMGKSERKLKFSGAERLRAAFHPTPADRLNDWIIDFDESPAEIKRRLEAMPQLPVIPLLGLILLDGTKPAARVRSERVTVAARGKEAPSSQWKGVLSADKQGKAMLTGKVVDESFFPLSWLGNFFPTIINGLLILFALALLLSGIHSWPYLVIPAFLYFFHLIMIRSEHRRMRCHEQALEIFFRERVGAQSITLKPRIEPFSGEWFKNFLPNR